MTRNNGFRPPDQAWGAKTATDGVVKRIIKHGMRLPGSSFDHPLGAPVRCASERKPKAPLPKRPARRHPLQILHTVLLGANQSSPSPRRRAAAYVASRRSSATPVSALGEASSVPPGMLRTTARGSLCLSGGYPMGVKPLDTPRKQERYSNYQHGPCARMTHTNREDDPAHPPLSISKWRRSRSSNRGKMRGGPAESKARETALLLGAHGRRELPDPLPTAVERKLRTRK